MPKKFRELLFQIGLVLGAIVLAKWLDFSLGYIGAAILAIAFTVQWIMQRDEEERDNEPTGLFGGQIPWAEKRKREAVNEQHSLPKSNVTQLSGFNYPSVDFILIPEKILGNAVIMHMPHLELSIRNRGNYALKDMRMRPTMYQLDLRFKVHRRVEKLPENKVRIYPGKTETVIKNFARIGKDSVKIRSIAPGTKSKPIDLSTLKEFKFVKSPGPGEPGGLGGPPLLESDTFRYYALRYSFIDDGTQKRYSFYQVISCQEPYLLPLDNPNMSIIGTETESDDDWLLRPSQLIIDHQRKIYGSYQEEEYRPSGSAMPQL